MSRPNSLAQDGIHAGKSCKKLVTYKGTNKKLTLLRIRGVRFLTVGLESYNYEKREKMNKSYGAGLELGLSG